MNKILLGLEDLVSLSERSKMANRWEADYFISIHFNAGKGIGFNPRTREGCDYWLSPCVTIVVVKIKNSILEKEHRGILP